jgi:hypothetical protein
MVLLPQQSRITDFIFKVVTLYHDYIPHPGSIGDGVNKLFINMTISELEHWDRGKHSRSR